MYAHPDDVDLFVGGLAEDVEADGLVGPTFSCIIALQFQMIRVSDRFWYSGDRQGLSPAELDLVYSEGVLSRVLARILDDPASKVPLDALRVPDVESNPVVPASELHTLDLSVLRDPQASAPKGCEFRGRQFPPGGAVQLSPCLQCDCRPNGLLNCEPRHIECEVLYQYVDPAKADEFCHRICPVNSEGAQSTPLQAPILLPEPIYHPSLAELPLVEFDLAREEPVIGPLNENFLPIRGPFEASVIEDSRPLPVGRPHGLSSVYPPQSNFPHNEYVGGPFRESVRGDRVDSQYPNFPTHGFQQHFGRPTEQAPHTGSSTPQRGQHGSKAPVRHRPSGSQDADSYENPSNNALHELISV